MVVIVTHTAAFGRIFNIAADGVVVFINVSVQFDISIINLFDFSARILRAPGKS